MTSSSLPSRPRPRSHTQLIYFATCCLVYHLVTLLCTSIPTVSGDLLSYNHAAVYYDKRLYFIGGLKSIPGPLVGNDTATPTYLPQPYSLYLGEEFSAHVPAWETNYVDRNDGPLVAGHTATLLRRQDDTPVIVVGGGDGPAGERARSSFIAYNLKMKSWTRWGIDGDRLWGATAVYAPEIQRIVYFGGQTVGNNGPEDDSENADLHLFDPESLDWSSPNYPAANDRTDSFPLARYQHRAVMINNTHMAVLGGCSNGSLVDPNMVHLYDTVNAVWSQVDATGAWFPGLKLFGIASYYNQIIVTGGVTNMEQTEYFSDIAVLNSQSWTWSRPGLPDKDKIGMARFGHTSTLIGKYLISAMGVLKVDTDSIYGVTNSNSTSNSTESMSSATASTSSSAPSPSSSSHASPVKRSSNGLLVNPDRRRGLRTDQPSDKDQLVVVDVAAWKTVEWFSLSSALSGNQDPVNSAYLSLAQGAGDLSVGAIIGIVVGAVAFLLSLVGAMWLCKRRRRRLSTLQRRNTRTSANHRRPSKAGRADEESHDHRNSSSKRSATVNRVDSAAHMSDKDESASLVGGSGSNPKKHRNGGGSLGPDCEVGSDESSCHDSILSGSTGLKGAIGGSKRRKKTGESKKVKRKKSKRSKKAKEAGTLTDREDPDTEPGETLPRRRRKKSSKRSDAAAAATGATQVLYDEPESTPRSSISAPPFGSILNPSGSLASMIEDSRPSISSSGTAVATNGLGGPRRSASIDDPATARPRKNTLTSTTNSSTSDARQALPRHRTSTSISSPAPNPAHLRLSLSESPLNPRFHDKQTGGTSHHHSSSGPTERDGTTGRLPLPRQPHHVASHSSSLAGSGAESSTNSPGGNGGARPSTSSKASRSKSGPNGNSGSGSKAKTGRSKSFNTPQQPPPTFHHLPGIPAGSLMMPPQMMMAPPGAMPHHHPGAITFAPTWMVPPPGSPSPSHLAESGRQRSNTTSGPNRSQPPPSVTSYFTGLNHSSSNLNSSMANSVVAGGGGGGPGPAPVFMATPPGGLPHHPHPHQFHMTAPMGGAPHHPHFAPGFHPHHPHLHLPYQHPVMMHPQQQQSLPQQTQPALSSSPVPKQRPADNDSSRPPS
ncbi:hypothetical protein BJ085DRAFT_35903 [Dimargaris cristalligena]|uniref:Galactose oxidase n=1 Tax=Dimargaris cristalligena TaxID=215637 RepID=A0A4P9ZTW3_9FUNG|nr:hypothetical protein BJ085DRAFT_35903 [Dimargaris cristalligena]|eukprot:RKP36212.1 hypothetical protein BJ085DRAFT_35903 [Dimargaris cristalligena]